jgi:hypothetical protein
MKSGAVRVAGRRPSGSPREDASDGQGNGSGPRQVGDGPQSGDAAPGDDRPLGGYAALLATYGISTGVIVLALRRRRGRATPTGPLDLLLLALATQRLTRTIAKDSVTAPLRAPFTRFEGPAGEGGSNEEPVGSGMRKAVAELLTCPFCLGQWVVTALVAGRVATPGLTDAAVRVLALAQANDYLQLAYAALRDRT